MDLRLMLHGGAGAKDPQLMRATLANVFGNFSDYVCDRLTLGNFLVSNCR